MSTHFQQQFREDLPGTALLGSKNHMGNKRRVAVIKSAYGFIAFVTIVATKSKVFEGYA